MGRGAPWARAVDKVPPAPEEYNSPPGGGSAPVGLRRCGTGNGQGETESGAGLLVELRPGPPAQRLDRLPYDARPRPVPSLHPRRVSARKKRLKSRSRTSAAPRCRCRAPCTTSSGRPPVAAPPPRTSHPAAPAGVAYLIGVRDVVRQAQLQRGGVHLHRREVARHPHHPPRRGDVAELPDHLRHRRQQDVALLLPGLASVRLSSSRSCSTASIASAFAAHHRRRSGPPASGRSAPSSSKHPPPRRAAPIRFFSSCDTVRLKPRRRSSRSFTRWSASRRNWSVVTCWITVSARKRRCPHPSSSRLPAAPRSVHRAHQEGEEHAPQQLVLLQDLVRPKPCAWRSAPSSIAFPITGTSAVISSAGSSR